jgi:hypothetical protein
MMWMGRLSGWGAIVMGIAILVVPFSQLALPELTIALAFHVATAALLLISGFRTLRQMSGGLRLLAGAWGFVSGTLLTAMASAPGLFGWAYYVAAAITLTFLALTVLHKEKKK